MDSSWAEGSVEPRDFRAISSSPAPIPKESRVFQKLEVLSGLVSDGNNHYDSVLRENYHEEAMFSVMSTLDGIQVME